MTAPRIVMQHFRSFLSTLRPEVDLALDQLLPGADEAPARLHQAIRYSVFAGGKRIRPALVLLTGEALGVPRPRLMPGACALEMIHCYSLIHDDLPALDNDDLRRGKPTVHRQYDESTAILAGDALLTLGLTTLAAAKPFRPGHQEDGSAVSLVGESIGSRGMIGGQFDDLAAEHNWPEQPEAALESIHARKTGALITACFRLAGFYSGVDRDRDATLRELGQSIGLLFQIADDILDVEGTDESLGKTAGKDIAARKLTYPGLFGLKESKELRQRVSDRSLELCRALPDGAGMLPSLIEFLSQRDH